MPTALKKKPRPKSSDILPFGKILEEKEFFEGICRVKLQLLVPRKKR